jgi:hypothetical protein
MKRTLLSGLLVLQLFSASAQNHHNHEHPMHAGAHQYHIGFGVAATHIVNEGGLIPGIHTEVIYEFNLGKLHIGPMAGFGMYREDSHFSVGVHVGIGL